MGEKSKKKQIKK